MLTGKNVQTISTADYNLNQNGNLSGLGFLKGLVLSGFGFIDCYFSIE